ncbi:MAG: cupin domain-containing protein [Solirubrobacteraceae bacterium]
MADEAPLKRTPAGLVPQGSGWFVLNARDAPWQTGEFGAYTRFEGDARFESLGLNIAVLEPGQPSCYYHAEDDQEDFLVLSGECLLLIEEQERPLRQWDFVHCPAWTRHVFVGAGEGPCTLLAVGTRQGDGVVYPASELAQRHRAGVSQETRSPDDAYAGLADDVETACRPEWPAEG